MTGRDRIPDRSDARWTHDVVLTDGTTVQVRPIRPTDADGLRAFHERQSRESIYFRFFSPRPQLTEADARRLAEVDGIDRMAFVAERNDELVGVARYDRDPTTPIAEAAFFTDDQMTGRGIATVLLEYLAAYARDAGILRFEAHVLPENRKMTSVFRQAGYKAKSAFADGVIEVKLDLRPSSDATEAMEARARSAERQSVVRLLEPGSIAVIGAGRNPAGIGHRVLRNLIDAGFHGPVHPVHPTVRSVGGVRAHATIADVPDDIDLAVVCVPAPEVVSVVEDCGRAGVGAVVVISAGFAETGPAGVEAQDAVVAVARRFGMRVLGPNCLGVVNTDPDIGMHATFAEVPTIPGRVGLLAQSGTFGAVMLARAHRIGLGISNFIAVGNKSDLSGNDLLQYWLDDDRTDVVLLYLESFGNPRRFGRNVRRVASSKPVFAVRTGAAFDRGAGSETSGWLDDRTIDALLRQTGVVRTPTVKGLLDAGLVASCQPVPGGSGVVIVGNSGGNVMAADVCAQAGLSLVELHPSTVTAIDDLRLHGRPGSNPVDLAYDATPDDYAAVLDAVLVDPGVDIALVVHAPYGGQHPAEIADVLDRCSMAHPSTTVVASVHGDLPHRTAGGVPIFDFPDDAALAVSVLARYAAWRDDEEAGEVLSCPHPEAVARLARTALGGEQATKLGPVQARELLAAAGIETVPVRVVESAEELSGLDVATFAEVGRVALKSVDHLTGATTVEGGVALDLADDEAVAEAAQAIDRAMGERAWPMIVQPMVPSGLDVRIAVQDHPIVGTVLQLGPGGGAARYTEAALRVLPITDIAARQLVEESGLGDVLSEPSVERLVELVRQVAAIADAATEVVTVECDPVIVSADCLSVVEVRLATAEVHEVNPDVRGVSV